MNDGHPTERVRADGNAGSLLAILSGIARAPVTGLLRRWNWKSAILSAGSRGVVFFCANLSAGHEAAFAAFQTEVWLRLATAGFYGAFTEALGGVEPAWHGMAAALVLLPIVAHALELGVHWLRGTAELAASILASAAFTALSTAFNMYAMRRGVLIVGRGRRPLHRDLLQVPALVCGFSAATARTVRRAWCLRPWARPT